VRGEALRVCGLYLPNGNPAPGPKYDYKLAWMERLRARAAALMAAEEPAVLAGDFNVIPQDEDAARPEAWATTRWPCPKAARRSGGSRPGLYRRAPRAPPGPGLQLLGLPGRRVGEATTASASTICC
jgi:endonuclease/exonuclease/phosphatase (EEP) superfamily protein YafD